MTTALDTRKAVQALLQVSQDGEIGPATMAALNHLCALPDASPWPVPPPASDSEVHTVVATSFADPADVRAFRACKAEGKTDQQCFAVGDNAIGFTGLDCSEGSGPACALPPEYWTAKWGSSAEAAGKPVLVSFNGVTVTVAMKDTMPHLANIHNGAGIDLNPDACAALGLTPPLRQEGVTWQWA